MAATNAELHALLDEHLRLGALHDDGRPELDRLPALPDHRQGTVGGDLVEPGAQGALEPVEVPPGPLQGLLHGVLGVVHRPEQPVTVGPQFVPVSGDLVKDVTPPILAEPAG